MEVIPAIDLRGGAVVRLLQGNYDRQTTFGNDPVGVARRFEADGAPRIHVVDLDGAREGRRTQAAEVRAVAAAVGIPIELGGGLRS
ncbi:MAG: 1-(5-phosphoribosyl)-5-((5-phosphoribosylamino)methylideneamino)imidazole-4-carboxamide isomerase, partial [Chloroflexi bacterium]|nr:1-(5-phosphoribosyl)-5-((5-phosphoribosylamino)methylideneamino)imidazole-4-carboxamide isomerase [Chloroflexota bacterium]